VIPILLFGNPISSYGSLARSFEHVLRLSGDSGIPKARTLQYAFCHRAWHPRTRRQARSSPVLAQGLPIQPGWPHCPMQRRRSTPQRMPPGPPPVASTSLQPGGYRPALRCLAVQQIGKRNSCSDIGWHSKADRRRPEAAGSVTLRQANRWRMRKKAVAHNPASRLQEIPIRSKRSKVTIRDPTCGGSGATEKGGQLGLPGSLTGSRHSLPLVARKCVPAKDR
jgi:hypothetical protein